jgi:GNAT superfamily N-acetyltransferase
MTTAASEILLVPLPASDEPFLWEMLYLALHVPEGRPPFAREIVHEPDLACYVQGWGRPGDWGLLACDGERRAGAVWMRQWAGEEKGYGFVAPSIPELSIAVLPEYRNLGLGRRMIAAVIATARDRHPGLSLSVVESSPARRLYERIGFRPLDHKVGESLVMLLDWSHDG